MSRYQVKDWSPADFFELISWFGECWSSAFPALKLITCKWRPEDLIPGLSDVDLRVVSLEAAADDWVRLDELAYRTHLEIVCTRPEWARKLEHTPGVCVTRGELFDPHLFHPETREWDYYWGNRELFNEIRSYVVTRPWGPDDEYYFLAKRFIPWCTPYNHSIDVPINIPPHILPKYALHSRVMHYFVPCIKAGLAVLNRDTVTGKREALYRWAQLYPHEPILNEVIELLDLHYEVPWLEDEHAWYAFEERLWHFIQKIAPEVLDTVSIIELDGNLTLENARQKLTAYSDRPMMTLFNGVRFSRIRRGRWQFYLDAPHFFDSDRLCFVEISWLANTFAAPLFGAYARIKWGERGLPLDEILNRMLPELIDRREAELIRRIFSAASGSASAKEAKAQLREITPMYTDYYLILERMLADARRELEGEQEI